MMCKQYIVNEAGLVFTDNIHGQKHYVHDALKPSGVWGANGVSVYVFVFGVFDVTAGTEQTYVRERLHAYQIYLIMMMNSKMKNIFATST